MGRKIIIKTRVEINNIKKQPNKKKNNDYETIAGF